jgi:hypothetical protein
MISGTTNPSRQSPGQRQQSDPIRHPARSVGGPGAWPIGAPRLSWLACTVPIPDLIIAVNGHVGHCQADRTGIGMQRARKRPKAPRSNRLSGCCGGRLAWR